jgi:hypothetical protein
MVLGQLNGRIHDRDGDNRNIKYVVLIVMPTVFFNFETLELLNLLTSHIWSKLGDPLGTIK